MRTPKLLLSFAAVLALSTTGCIKSMIADGTIKGTRDASSVMDTIGDYELARNAASAGMVQFEGMHRLRPENEDAMFLLAKGWTGYGYAFPSDDLEAANLAGDEAAAEYHKKRAKHAFERAIKYAVELIEHRGVKGFDEAKKKEAPLKQWLNTHFSTREDAEVLYWLGAAWLARVMALRDEPEYVASLFVGVAILEKSVDIYPAYQDWGGTANLASYHARAAMAELDQSRDMFEKALAKTNRKLLLVQYNYAAKYACMKNDKGLYEKLLNEVVTTDQYPPEFSLQNAVAKRRAARALKKEAMQECGF